MEETMVRRVSIAFVLAVLLLAPGTLFAAAAKTPAVILAYFEDVSGALTVRDDKGRDVAPEVGMDLKKGWQIMTQSGDYAELQLPHNGSIIKVSQKTSFKVDALQTEADKSSVNAFTLSVGKIRTVAGKTTGKEQYRVTTQSAVCGVRGTDFAMLADMVENDTTYVFRGKVSLKSLLTGAEIEVGQGQMANALASVFQAMEIPADLFKSLMDELNFKSLDANTVPQLAEAINAAVGEGGTPAEGEGAGEKPPAPAKSSFMDGIMAKLKEILGMEIGSVTISGETWAKVVVQPTFKVGPLKTALYLPVIYRENMFDTDGWYKPAGNNEWSFGRDKTGALAIAGDIASDLVLKIKYLEWGSQRDPFFFKLGNLNDITVGHGLIMRKFANDADFPAVRRVGVNLGMDFKSFGFEAMVNDAAAIDVFGGRVYTRPIPNFKAAIGLSALVDIAPAKDYFDGAAVNPVAAGDPIFLNPGVDLDIPIVESKVFGLVAFADAAVMLPYFRSPTAGGIPSGFAWNAIATPGADIPVKNYGIAAGVFGNLVFPGFTYRLEFRDYTGVFKPQFYSTGYERERSSYVKDVLTYLADTSNWIYDRTSMGVFLEGGFNLEKLFGLELSYFWPWSIDPVTKQITTSLDDRFVAKFTLQKGVIPVVNIFGSVSYERAQFAPTILKTGAAGLNLFDANTVVRAEVNYPAAPMLDVRILYTTTAKRVDGVLVYKPGAVLPEMEQSIAVETLVHL
jgi:hypothetical protein